jgi:hypothetical protein
VNVEQLKQRIAAQVTEVDGFRLAKLTAAEGIQFSQRASEFPSDAPPEQLVEHYAWLLSKCSVDERGERGLDSDEGRQTLARLDIATLTSVGEAAIDWNLGDAKKN